tara:strand:- start:129 stop:554 length:426 start_codon:yes stop_codon:yes gene_type:complete
MKKIILLILLTFSLSCIDTETKNINEGLLMLNTIRAFSNKKPLIINPDLNKFAAQEAQEFADKEMYYFQKDGKGKSYYWKSLDEGGSYNYTTAVLALALNEPWAKKRTYNRMKCKTCTSVGFGQAKNNTKHYFFVVYDSLR